MTAKIDADVAIEAINAGNRRLDKLTPTLELDEARHVLRDAERSYKDLAAVLDTLRGHVYELLPSDVTEYTADDGLPPIKRSWKGASSEKWERGDDLARLVAARTEPLWVDENGTVKPAAVIADTVAQAIAKACGFTASKSWRKTELEAIGIESKLFVNRGDGGRPSVRWLA